MRGQRVAEDHPLGTMNVSESDFTTVWAGSCPDILRSAYEQVILNQLVNNVEGERGSPAGFQPASMTFLRTDQSTERPAELPAAADN